MFLVISVLDLGFSNTYNYILSVQASFLCNPIEGHLDLFWVMLGDTKEEGGCQGE
jgi:hypothetical protein